MRGLYFVTVAASTGGLLGPDLANKGSVMFVCFLCIIGVPLYVRCLGEIANFFTQKYLSKSAEKKRMQAISQNKINFVREL